jgi:hypothetical protein
MKKLLIVLIGINSLICASQESNIFTRLKNDKPLAGSVLAGFSVGSFATLCTLRKLSSVSSKAPFNGSSLYKKFQLIGFMCGAMANAYYFSNKKI